MTADNPIWAPDEDAQAHRESRINLALLRGVLDNLRGNRKTIPLFALAVAAIFAQWVSPVWLGVWYAHVLLGVGAQLLLIKHFPQGELTPQTARKWTWIAAGVNLFFVANWASLGWSMVGVARPSTTTEDSGCQISVTGTAMVALRGLVRM